MTSDIPRHQNSIYLKTAQLLFLAGIILIPPAVWNGTLAAIQIKFMLARLMVVVAAIPLVLDTVATRKIPVPRKTVAASAGLFIIYATINLNVTPFANLLVYSDLILSFVLFFEAVLLLSSERFRVNLLFLWQLTTLPVCLYHLLQLTGHDFMNWSQPGFAGSTFGNRNALSCYLLCSFPFGLYLTLTRTGRPRLTAAIPTALTFVTIFAGHGRAPKLLIILLLPVFLLYMSRRLHSPRYTKAFRIGAYSIGLLLAITTIAAGIHAAGLPFERLNSFSHYRLQIWKEALPFITENALFGQGAGSFPRLFPVSRSRRLGLLFGEYDQILNSHNECMELVAEYGIAGLVLLSLFIASVIIRRHRKYLHLDTGKRDLLFFSGISLAGSFLLAQLAAVSHFFYCGLFSWLSLALFYTAAEKKPFADYTIGSTPGTVLHRCCAGVIVVSALLSSWFFGKVFFSDMYTRKASQCITTGSDLEQAAGYLETALSLQPDNLYARYQQAYVAMTGDNDIQALAEYEIIRKKEPCFEKLHYNIGIIYYRRRNYAEAVRELSITARIHPAFQDGIYYLAKSCYGAGKLKESLAWSNWLLAMNPGKEEYRHLHGVVSDEAGNGK